MSESADKLESLFDAVVQLPLDQRPAFIARACGSDGELRRRVERLLRNLDRAGNFLAQGETAGSEGIAPGTLVTERPGDRIGRYKLLQKIGEGGCGVVYMAEQEEPVRRRVALKIIKLGMDTRRVIARFEAERQALALMDHPHIARVLDAGSTENGRPYFVMELVRGTRITDYCDEKSLSTRQRLDLFIQVCQAVQHAHQKGIIHRDLKPSNILVSVNDSVAVPKVIDFGIAKATTDQRLTDKTVFTAFEQFIGTPAYMSPEQAEVTNVDVDTRSDIYSLGVLLYELLTGKTPFDPAELLKVGLDELRRTIREKEPERPSTRVSALDSNELTTTAKRRGLEAPRLAPVLRGDLDWIVMRCLEKDRARRYETANGLASDIQRHLKNEPVVACPPSRLYRFQKMVRRNRAVFASAGAIVAALLVGLGVSTWMFLGEREARFMQARLRQEAITARNQAKSEAQGARTAAAKSRQVVQFFEEMLAGAGPEVAKGRDATILKEILDKTAQRIGTDLTNQPAVEADLRYELGKVYLDLGDYRSAEPMQRRAVALYRQLYPNGHRDLANNLDSLAVTLSLEGQLPEAERLSREAVAMGKKFHDAEHADMGSWLTDLAMILKHEGNYGEAEPIYREALAINRKVHGNEHREVVTSLVNLAIVLAEQKKYDEATGLMSEALQTGRRLWGNEHPLIARALTSLTEMLSQQGKFTEAEATGREAVAMERKLSGPEHTDLATALANLAGVLVEEDKLPEAEALHREALAIRRTAHGNENPWVANSLRELGSVLSKRGALAEAEALLRECLDLSRKLPPNDYVDLEGVYFELVKVLRTQGKEPEANALAEEAKTLHKDLK